MAELLGTVRRALHVLDHLAEADGPVPIKRLASALDLTLASAYHVVNTLAADGYVSRDPAGGYALGAKAARLGEAYARSWPVEPRLREIVRELGARTRENAYVALLNGSQVVIIDIAESHQRVRVNALQRGFAEDLHARALGKAVLAYRTPSEVRLHFASQPPRRLTRRTRTSFAAVEEELDRTRRRGYSEDLEEFADGVCCLGAPFFAGGVVAGAFSVALPAFRYRVAKASVRTAVLAAARAATDALSSSDRRVSLG